MNPDRPLDLAQFMAERNIALRTLDLNKLKRFSRDHDLPDDIVLIGAHKARYECMDIESHLRLESGEWLRSHGYKRLGGLEVLPPGVLPE